MPLVQCQIWYHHHEIPQQLYHKVLRGQFFRGESIPSVISLADTGSHGVSDYFMEATPPTCLQCLQLAIHL